MALIDSGCTRTLVHESVCGQWRRSAAEVITVSGQRLRCEGAAEVRLAVPGCCAVEVSALVIRERPLGFSVIAGMDAVQSLGGVTVRSPSDVQFGCEFSSGVSNMQLGRQSVACAATSAETRLKVEKEDFVVVFDQTQRQWVMSWKWAGGRPPSELGAAVSEYPVPAEARAEYDAELENWIRDGWLCEYDEEELGPAKGSIPLMAVVQRTKVRPVMDFRALNKHVTAFTGDADVCAERLRRWRQMGASVALLDLKKAFLQIHVEKALWPYQTVWYRGQRYALTRLGFGLSVASSVMQAVLDLAVAQDPRVSAAVSTYVDDILVDETKLPAARVAEHLQAYGLESKVPQRASDGARILGLRVWGEPDGDLRWSRDNQITDVPKPLTKRKVFSICGQLTSHYPVCGWLRPAASFVKRLANETASRWDDPIEENAVTQLVEELVASVRTDDPAKGRWNVSGDTMTVYTDASSLALGVALEVDGEVVEDASWLRRADDAAHINLAELDAVVKGVNLALQWRVTDMDLVTDSRTVWQWVSDTLSGRARLRSKAASEMLIRRRLSTLKALKDEYGLNVHIRYVPSAANKADPLTRVPGKWLRERAAVEPTSDTAAARVIASAITTDSAAGTRRQPAVSSADSSSAGPGPTTDSTAEPPAAAGETGAAGSAAIAAATADSASASRSAGEDGDATRRKVSEIHHTAGHPGVRRTFFFARRVLPGVTKGLVRGVVSTCELCRSIDPAPVKWRKGELSVDQVWDRVAMDVTHVRGRAYLTLIDCGPSRFCIWRPLRLQTSSAVVEQLESIFLERGPPRELLADNDPAFRSRRFHAFATRWGVQLRFRCAYVASGNGVVERCHRSIKVIAARKDCSVAEAVYRYNVTPLNDETADSAPANVLYRYEVRVQGLDERVPPEPRVCELSDGMAHGHSRYRSGDSVWVRPPRARCDTKYDKGEVTRVISDQCVEVNGVPRHVRELRRRSRSENGVEDAANGESDCEPVVLTWPRAVGGDGCGDSAESDLSDTAGDDIDGDAEGGEHELPRPRTSGRLRRPNSRYLECC